jgi:hypothetical protein
MQTLNQIEDWAFPVLALLFFIIVILIMWKALRNDYAGSTTVTALTSAVVIAVFCALMASPDRFQRLQFSPITGIVAEARQATREAQVTLKQLQDLSVALAEANLNQMVTVMNTPGKFEIHDRIVALLRQINAPNDKIFKIQTVWRSAYCSELLDSISYLMQKALPSQSNTLQYEIRDISTDKKVNLPNPEVLQTWVSTKHINNDRLSELIKAYKEIWETGSLKEPELLALIPGNAFPSPLPTTR